MVLLEQCKKRESLIFIIDLICSQVSSACTRKRLDGDFIFLPSDVVSLVKGSGR